MELELGLRDVARQLSVEIPAETEAEVLAQIEEAVAGQRPQLDITDAKEDRLLIPASAIAYVRIGKKTAHRVGFSL